MGGWDGPVGAVCLPPVCCRMGDSVGRRTAWERLQFVPLQLPKFSCRHWECLRFFCFGHIGQDSLLRPKLARTSPCWWLPGRSPVCGMRPQRCNLQARTILSLGAGEVSAMVPQELLPVVARVLCDRGVNDATQDSLWRGHISLFSHMNASPLS